MGKWVWEYGIELLVVYIYSFVCFEVIEFKSVILIVEGIAIRITPLAERDVKISGEGPEVHIFIYDKA